VKKGKIIIIMVIGLCLIASSALAAVYVSDNLEAPLRTGPGTKYKIVSVLRSGEAVNVISEEEGWSNVRPVGDKDGKQGWILSRYLMNREPWERRVRVLERENADLRKRLFPAEKTLREMKGENVDLASSLKKKMNEAETLERKYESLKKGAAGFLELKENYEKTRSDLTKTKGELAEVMEENNLLRSSSRNKWFLSGAMVLLFGLVIGLIMGRREKRRSSRLQM
jgi:SH3 domain protein